MSKHFRSWTVRMLCCLSCILLLALQGRAQYTPRPEASPAGFLAFNSPLSGTASGGTCHDGFSIGAYSGFSTKSFDRTDFSNPGGFRFSNEFYSASDLFSAEKLFSTDALAFFKKPKQDTLFEASPGVDPKLLTFKQRNSGAFKRKKRGGLKSPGMAALCSAVVPGLGQIYNGQWYKTPVIYAGAAVLAYFTDDMLKNRNIYQDEIKLRTDSTATNFNPNLTSYSLNELLELRNYYEHNFELCIIIAGAVYLLNIVDAIVYAHLSSFNVNPNLAMSIKPYARTNFHIRNGFPMDAGIKVCLTLK